MNIEEKNRNILFFGHNAEINDFFATKNGNFSDSLKKIQDLISKKQEKNIEISIPIIISDSKERSNLAILDKILKFLVGFGVKKIKLILTNPGSDIKPYLSIDKIAGSIIYDILPRFSYNLFFKIENIPLCFLRSIYGYPLTELLGNKKIIDGFMKFGQCRKCYYFEQCAGVPEGYIFDESEIKKVKPIIFPLEVTLEVESKCNFNCQFCFNKNSFARKDRWHKKLEKKYIKQIIDKISESSIEAVRFTGGEPLLRDDIFDLLEYAKSKNLTVRLNTNASLISDYKIAEQIAKYSDFVLISMHSFDQSTDSKITGSKGSFLNKIKAMKWLKEAGLKVLRMSTIATIENILNLDKFYLLLKDLKVDSWAVNRPIPNLGEKDDFTKQKLSLLVDQLIKIKIKALEDGNKYFFADILNAVPLCALENILELNTVCAGGWAVDGHTRFIVDPRGFAKPMYYIDKDIGDPLNPIECWDHPFMKDLRGDKLVPKECSNCCFLTKCKGGNRFCAYNSESSYNGADPLMEFSNVKKYLKI